MSNTPDHAVEDIALHEATRLRYLNYALSVITARALPDVRDGLKPVQRRILYAMYTNLKLTPEARYRKSAAVVGEVMAKYHPHGDSSIYEAMVRMAQTFSLLHPLVDGQGNFGSMDGDSAAAMRYTECRLRPIAEELLSEIKQRTVEFRPNYDGQHSEPLVLPAQFPQVLVNGSEGIAVGMATRIPPHNLSEVIDAAVHLIESPEASVEDLCRVVRGPDFPTGGLISSSRSEIEEIYRSGQGSIKLRGRWSAEKQGRRNLVVITEIPYAVNKATLVARIGELVAEKALPQLLDVRDESTEAVRVVLELRSPEDAAAAMAYLLKHTALQCAIHVNLTCLVPTAEEHLPAQPARLNLREILRYWLDFRFETVRRRFVFELSALRERIHILEGFARIFDALDETIRIIRASEGRRDASDRLMVRFDLDDAQVEAILELRLYKLARLEIHIILEELAEKRAAAERIEGILSSDGELWAQVRSELRQLRKAYGVDRRTGFLGEEAPTPQYSEDAYIVREDAFVIATREGWFKRQGSFSEVEKIRVREGDTVGWLGLGDTRQTVTFFTSRGGAYTMRIADVPVTTGHGEPIQRHFSFEDGERVVGVVVHDPRSLPAIDPAIVAASTDEAPAPPHAVAISRNGRCLRFPLAAHAEPSNKNGRRYMKTDEEGDEVVIVMISDASEHLCLVSEGGKALCFPVTEINMVKAAGKGVQAIKLSEDRVYAAALTSDLSQGVAIVDSMERTHLIHPARHLGPRAGSGSPLWRNRSRCQRWDQPVLRLDLLRQPGILMLSPTPRPTES